MIGRAESQTIQNRGRILALRSTLLLFLILLLPSPATATETGLKKGTLIPLWSPQAQFAGYYVALDKGIYARHGIDLTILTGGPDVSPSLLLQNGEADFAVLWLTTALQQHAEGEEFVNIAQIIQKSSMMLVAKTSSEIKSPTDMEGKKVGLWGGDLTLPAEAFFRKFAVKVRRVPQSYTVNLFLRGGIDVASAMWYNEYHTILNSGFNPEELNLFFLSNYGINFPEDGLYTLAKTYRQDPDRAKAFVKASLEGWQYAFAHPEEALDIVIRYMKMAKVPANRTHQRWMLNRMQDLIRTGDKDEVMGRLNAADYERVGAELTRSGIIKALPGFGEFIGGPDAQ